MTTTDDGPCAQFSNELDALINRWRTKPKDDRLTGSEMVGALAFAASEIILWAREQVQP